MPNLLTTWRQAVVDHLSTNLQGGAFTVLASQRDGPSRDRKLACVFVAPTAQWPQDANFLRPVLTVRAWVPKPKTPKASEPPDPAPLEQLMADLIGVFENVRTSLVDPSSLYFEVENVEADYDDFGVQAQLVAYALKLQVDE